MAQRKWVLGSAPTGVPPAPSGCCILLWRAPHPCSTPQLTATSPNKGFLLQPKSLLPLTEEDVGLGRGCGNLLWKEITGPCQAWSLAYSHTHVLERPQHGSFVEPTASSVCLSIVF